MERQDIFITKLHYVHVTLTCTLLQIKVSKFRKVLEYLWSILLCSSTLFLFSNLNIVVLKVPLPKRGCINLDNCTFHQGLCSNKFIVWGIVNHIQKTCFTSNSFSTPREVPSVQPESPPLHITSSDPNSPHSLVTWELSVCRLTTELIPTYGKGVEHMRNLAYMSLWDIQGKRKNWQWPLNTKWIQTRHTVGQTISKWIQNLNWFFSVTFLTTLHTMDKILKGLSIYIEPLP